MTPGDLPCFRRRTGGAPGQTSLEADEAENAKPKIVVQRQQGCEPLTCSNVAKPQVMIARRVLGDDMVAVGSDGRSRASARGRPRQVPEPRESSQAQGQEQRWAVKARAARSSGGGLLARRDRGRKDNPQRREISAMAASSVMAPEAMRSKRLPEVFPIFRIAPQELPGKSRAIELLQRIARILRPPVHRSRHAWPPRSKAPQRAIRAVFWRSMVPLVLEDRMRDARRQRLFGSTIWRGRAFACQNNGVIVGEDAGDRGSPPASSSAPGRDDCHGRCGRVPVRDPDPGRR